MRVMGHNLLAILIAAAAIWAIGFLLYVVLFQQQWMEWMGLSDSEIEGAGGMRRLFMPVMPVLTASGVSRGIKWRDRPGWFDGVKARAGGFTIAGRMYGWVYLEPTNCSLDTLHFLLTHAIAGAILGAWK